MEDQWGIEPRAAGLKSRCHHQAGLYATDPNMWSSWVESNHHRTVINRLHWAVMLHDGTGGQVWFRSTPFQIGFTDQLPKPSALPAHVCEDGPPDV